MSAWIFAVLRPPPRGARVVIWHPLMKAAIFAYYRPEDGFYDPNEDGGIIRFSNIDWWQHEPLAPPEIDITP